MSSPVAPTAQATVPPISSHMVLSVGLPVKKRVNEDLIESDAFTPQVRRRSPATSRTKEKVLFMVEGGV